MSHPMQGEIRAWPVVPDNHPMDTKHRKWVVVSRDAFNKTSDHILLCPITSYPPTEIDIAVQATPHNTLDHDSAMLPRMITPVLKSELGPALARLPAKTMRLVADRLRMLTEVI